MEEFSLKQFNLTRFNPKPGKAVKSIRERDRDSEIQSWTPTPSFPVALGLRKGINVAIQITGADNRRK
jgi:hypothetical protein